VAATRTAESGAGGMLFFRPCLDTPMGCENCTRESHKMGRTHAVRGGGCRLCGFSTTRFGVHKVTNTYTARESLTNHIFKSKPNKSQTGYRIRKESFNIDLEASVDDLPAVPGLLVNPDLEFHDVSTGPATKRLSHHLPVRQRHLGGRKMREMYCKCRVHMK